jgi:O-antigen ligase
MGQQIFFDNRRVDRFNAIACLYGFWLSLDPIFGRLVPFNIELQNGLFLVLGAVIVTIHMAWRGTTPYTGGYGLLSFSGFTTILLVTMCVNVSPTSSATQIFLIIPLIFVMYVGLLSGSEPSRDWLRTVFASFALCGACTSMYYIWVFAGNERLAGDLNPNDFGLICTALACASLALRVTMVRAIVLAVACLGLYLTQSRSNMVGVAVAYAVIGMLYVLRLRGHAWLRLGIVFAAALLFVLLLFDKAFADFVRNGLLAMDDPQRGVGSGATGRTVAWHDGIELWRAAPLLGYGYRASDEFYQNRYVTSTHNGYIAMLVDLGLIGLLAYLLFVGIALKRALRAFASPARMEAVPTIALILAYSVMGMFERYALNTGNAASILFIIACFRFVSDPIAVNACARTAAR